MEEEEGVKKEGLKKEGEQEDTGPFISLLSSVRIISLPLPGKRGLRRYVRKGQGGGVRGDKSADKENGGMETLQRVRN